MPRSKSRKNVIRKEGWVKPVNEDLSKLLDEDFDGKDIDKRRKVHSDTALVKIRRDGTIIRPHKLQRVLKLGPNDIVKTSKNSTRPTLGLNPKKNRLVNTYNPKRNPVTKKKNCCERLFGRDAGKKKCKKKCKTRKKKRKKRTRKRKKRKKKR